jgi:PAS domain S-box-containing protein
MTLYRPGRHQRILVVDDNAAIHQDFRKILAQPDEEETELDEVEARIFGDGAKRCWFEVVSAMQGAEAVALAEQAQREGRPFSVAFIDVRMPPGWDGVETTCQLWKVCPHTQVVICTAYSDYSWSEVQQKVDPCDRLLILKKPFDSIEVLQVATALTEKWRLAEEAHNRLADLDRLVRERTRELEESRHEALMMMEEAVRNREQEKQAHESLKREMAERAQLEEQFREQASLLDKARDAILVCDLDHTITYWNKSAESLYGWAVKEAVGQRANHLLQTDAAGLEAAGSALRRSGEWVGDLHQVDRHGQPVVVESRWTLVRDSSGRPKGIFVINTDITESKRMAEHMLRAQRLESLGTLAGGIAHDLNNVLLPIMMSIDLLKLKVADREARSTLGSIEASARRGAEMVRQVLTFARGVEGERLRIDPAEVIEELRVIIRDTFPKNIVLVTRVPEKLPAFMADPTQVHQVLLNLCVNARDAMPDGGRLEIAVREARHDEMETHSCADSKAQRCVLFEVIDTGAGIPPEIRDKIFDPFFTTKAIGKGTGLGLSTAAAILKSHGGCITMSSEAGGGTCFKACWPAGAEPQAASAPANQDSLPCGDGELVLLVDDEEAVRKITEQTLQAFGYRVLTATDGAEAVALYAEHRQSVELVFTDMMMPVMDGVAAIEAIKRMNPEAKIVAASGMNANGCAAKAAAMGVKHFLNKPYTAQTMLATLKTAVAG